MFDASINSVRRCRDIIGSDQSLVKKIHMDESERLEVFKHSNVLARSCVSIVHKRSYIHV